MSQYPPIRILIELLEQSKLFDERIENDSIWISGTRNGVAFTCQFNIDNARGLHDQMWNYLGLNNGRTTETRNPGGS